MNHIRKILYTFVFLVLCGTLVAAPRFNAKSFKLANGMRVVVIENHRAPIVHHALWFRCGGIDDPEGNSGLAHFLEHLMFKATKNRATGEYDRILTEHGARFNAFTTSDVTCYHVEVLSDRLPLVMELEADRLENLVFDPNEVDAERKVIIEERRTRIENSPSALLSEAVNQALYWNHPYGRPLIGWKHEMETLELEDAQAFYKYWYAPNNAILILAGDITLAKAKNLAETYYGPLQAHTLPERNYLKEPVHNGVTQFLTLKHERVEHPEVAFYIPVSYEKEYEDSFILAILDHLLFDDPLGRVYQNLVEIKKLATWMTFSFDQVSLGPKYVVIRAQPAAGVFVEDLEKAIVAEMKVLKDLKFTDQDIKAVVDRIHANQAYEKDSIFAGAHEIGLNLSLGITLPRIEGAYDFIDGIRAHHVNEMVKKIFSTSPRVQTRLLPQEKKL